MGSNVCGVGSSENENGGACCLCVNTKFGGWRYCGDIELAGAKFYGDVQY